jgi:hypothetical protein
MSGSVIDRRMRARRWRAAAAWVGGLAASVLAVWVMTYAVHHPPGG